MRKYSRFENCDAPEIARDIELWNLKFNAEIQLLFKSPPRNVNYAKTDHDNNANDRIKGVEPCLKGLQLDALSP